jgi:hypothetical protein
MPDIDLPSLKEQLWQKMQGDLAKFVPDVVKRNRLMCCACGRFLPPEHFDVDRPPAPMPIHDQPLSRYSAAGAGLSVVEVLSGLAFDYHSSYYVASCKLCPGRLPLEF